MSNPDSNAGAPPRSRATYTQLQQLNAIATSLAETYKAECLKLTGKPVDLKAWDRDFGRTRRQEFNAAGCENAEEKAPVRGEGRRADCWRKLAQRLITIQADPADYVRCQFEVLPAGSAPPAPESLSSEQAQRNWAARQTNLAAELVTVRRLKNSAFQLAVQMNIHGPLKLTQVDAWARALNDSTVMMSALFRY